MKKNILMVTMSFDIGGAETHILELSKALKARGHEVFIASFGGVYEDVLREFQIEHFVIPLHSKNPIHVLKSYHLLLKIMKERKIDIVHAHARIAAFICGLACRKLKTPLVTTAHGTYNVTPLFRLLTNWGEKTLAVSSDIKNYIIENYNDVSPANIFLTVNGIDLENFRPKDKNPALKEELGIGSGPVLMHLGRLDKDAGEYAFRLAKVFPRLKEKIPNLTLLMVGGGSHFLELKATTDKINDEIGSKSIILTGPRVDIPEILSLCDCVVALSRAALESMAAKKPVILAGNFGFMGLFGPGLKDAALQNNCTARSFPHASDDELISDCLKALSLTPDEKNGLGEFSHAFVSENYSIKKMVEDAEGIYKTLRAPGYKKAFDFLLLGYYGFHNSGDDAMLQAIIGNLKEKKPNLSLAILTQNIKESFMEFGLPSFRRFNPFHILKALHKSKALIFGGGNLIQDITSTKSLFYYIGMLLLAQIMGKKTILYSNGIGPVTKPLNLKIIKPILNRVDLITLRESESLEFLNHMNILNPSIFLTSDEALTLRLPPPCETDMLLNAENIPKDKPILCVSVRSWKNASKDFNLHLANVLDHLCEKYNFTILFLPMHLPHDFHISRDIKAHMKKSAYIISADYNASELIGIISKSHLVLGMRLHSLIYAAAAGVPACGLVYDNKVSAFLDSTENPHRLDVSSLTYDKLLSLCEGVLLNHEPEKEKILLKREELKKEAQKNSALTLKVLEALE